MKRTSVCALAHLPDQIVKIQGFVETIRDQKHIAFLFVRDRTGIIQVVCDKKMIALDDIIIASAVTITGKVVETSQAKNVGIEIHCTHIVIDSKAETPLPISSDSSMDKKLDWRSVSLRDPKYALLFRVQTTLEKALREYWDKHDFIEIHSPKLMATASELGAELFKLKYFDTTAYLAQSPQFYKQMAMAAGFERVFEIGPVFRAEKSMTTRHATEYTSIDIEVSWIDSYEDIMRIEEEMLHHALSMIHAQHGDEIERLFGSKICVPSLPFPRISLKEARSVLQGMGHVIAHKTDLDPSGEKLLSQYIMDKYGHEFVFVTDYPADIRAFYHMRHEHDVTLTQSFDLLWKGLEITTGAQREHRLDKLTMQAKEKGRSLEPLQHYFDFFRFGCPPHGGCGIGLERLLMVMLDRETIREVTYLYRGPNRLSP